ncbi:hypothetical protein ACKWTF_000603 [Chironomus riparius]
MADQKSIQSFKMIKLEDFLELQLKAYKLIGLNIIPIKITSQRTKVIEKLMKLYLFTCFIGMWLIVIQFGIRLIIDIDNLHVVVRVLPHITVFPYNFSKGILFFTKRKEILDVLEKLKKLFPKTQIDQEKCNLQSLLKQFLIFHKIYIGFALATVSCAIIGMLYQLIFNNVMKQAVEIWFPFDDTANNFNLIISMLWLIWTVSVSLVNVISADFYLFAIVLILSTEFSIFGEDIKNTINDGQTINLRNLFIRHQKLIEITDDIKSVFSFTFFFIQGAIAISSCGFQLLTTSSVEDLLFSVIYAVYSICQVYLYSFYGQKLITASHDVGKNILNSNWYELNDNKEKKLILFLIMRTQKPCMLSGFGSVSLSAETFSSVSFVI